MCMTHRFAALEDVDTLICLRFAYLEEDQGALDPGARSILRQQLSSYFPARWALLLSPSLPWTALSPFPPPAL